MRTRYLILSLLPLTATFCQAGWETSADSLAYQVDGKDLWRLNFSQTNDTKPHFSMLAPVGGPNLVCTKPKDHVWHYGLWFSWKYINGTNYWEESKGKAAGKTSWDAPVIETRDDGSATVTFTIHYTDLLDEARKLVISKTDADGGYTIDWSSTFTALKDVTLERYMPWGGYAGMSARLSQAFTNVQAVTAEGPTAFDKGKAHVDSTIAEMNGTIAGAEYGLTMAAEGTWYQICKPGKDNFFYFNDAVLYKNPKTLKAGESFALRYRIYIHKGRWDAAKLKSLVQ